MFQEKNEDASFFEAIITFTQDEANLVDEVLKEIATISDVSYERISKKLLDLEGVAKSISKYPSIKSTSQLAGSLRDVDSLLNALCKIDADSLLLSLPTKTILGKAYLVAKFHTFVAFLKVAEKLKLEEKYLKALHDVVFNIMFTIMAEDAYISLLSDPNISRDLRYDLARSLADLWESRLDMNMPQFSSILVSLWDARAKIAPVFGTMLGTSEFFSFSSHVGSKWASFISRKLALKEVAWALEEFLFGISYEEILYIRKKLIEEKIDAVSREDVFNMLERENSFKESDARSFYASYSERRHNADARKRLNVAGPKNILEDYCLKSFFENRSFWQDNIKK